ncbi:hypothetical protein C2L64_51375 [Paraburkholderia hospita]|uniref:Uncharacterized protein n=1 Tax=Paraburkholderia hospita TaxID=169430 RepID=A0AAN1JMM9_9BURK|nr:hypothetical protein C2L64_51375 [Paraburkholderia hospita]
MDARMRLNNRPHVRQALPPSDIQAAWRILSCGEQVTALFHRMSRLIQSMHDGFLHGGQAFM